MSRGKEKEEVYVDAAFVKNEKVLCYHGALIYEGKVLSVRKQILKKENNDPYTYLIHYAGWSKKWDEFVPESRVLRHNDENLKLQEEMKSSNQNVGAGSRKRLKGSTGKGATAAKRFATSDQVLGGGSDSANTSGLSMSGQDGGSEEVSEAERTLELDVTDVEVKQEDMSSEVADAETAIAVPGVLDIPKEEPLGDDTETDKEVSNANWSVDEEQHQLTSDNLLAKFVQKIEVLPKIPVVPLEEAEFQSLMPVKLQTMLATDYCMINTEKKLMKLPAKTSVDSVFEQYLAELNSSSVSNDMRNFQHAEFVRGLKGNFRREISEGYNLLYSAEHEQYTALLALLKELEDAETVDKCLTSMFGVTHLIRFCSRLVQHINKNRFDDEINVDLLKNFLLDFYTFVVSKFEDFFSDSDYITREPEAISA